MSPQLHSPGQHGQHGMHPPYPGPNSNPPARGVSPIRTGHYSSLDHALGHVSPQRDPGYGSGNSDSSRGHVGAPGDRYYYSQVQETSSNYDYPPYPQPPYESSQYNQHLPPMRSTTSRPQSPHHQYHQQSPPYGVAPSSYHVPYPQAPYGVPPATGSWQSGGPGSEPPSYGTSEATHAATRGVPAPTNASVSSKSRQRDREENLASRSSRPPAFSQQLDFNGIMHHYGSIMATADRDAPPSVSHDQAERMLYPAVEGLRLFDTNEAEKITKEKNYKLTPPGKADRSPKDPTLSASPGPASTSAAGKRHHKEEKVEGQKCKVCGATQTPEWRRGPLGPRTLCNACGLVYAKILKKRNRELAGGGRGNPASGGKSSRRAHADSGMGSSGEGSDDDSFGSHHSDGFGDR